MAPHRGFTEQERAILAALDAVGIASITTLADAASLKAHVVRYGLQNLLEQGLLSPFCSIDPAAIGFNSYIVYFSFEPTQAHLIESALTAIRSHQNISWLGELSGAFQYGCTLCARDAVHAMSLFEEISQQMNIQWQRKSITQRTHLTFWPLKLFSANMASSVAIQYPNRSVRREIDQLDHVILRLKGENPTIPHSEIARIARQAASTITYRIEQLSQNDIILGSWYAPNWNNLGIGHSEVSLLLKEISPRFIDDLVSFGRNTRSCHYVVGGMGSWDFQFNILSSHPTELQQFTSELWAKYGNKIETLNVSAYTRVLKYCTYPFVDLGGSP